MQVGGRSGVHLLLGPPGQQSGLAALKAFVADFANGQDLLRCRERFRGNPGEIYTSVSVTQEQIDEGRAQHPTVEYLGGQTMNAFEDCVLAALTAAAASYVLPPNLSPAHLGGLRFGMPEAHFVTPNARM